ncbi:MAG: ATPase, P-type (Transporting), HAD superfamily, subfamily IC [Candidatus Uhrbacteria bacterium GW2011_GWA2_52_8d]|uniref:ATPase, P-type (Transporting), HAD superfamily, subfamily IC n=1 Tax=Candidatus Uhrbacteria bacterium GW2011_GWA2_52_8d TaxID=1618979 RepID=A0A0G1XN64_9BACT|nr:MAG: ATPase, P-type (Transporting), HAD superfamily, subfamily IC [Candidatus Uhrbacteria bacterium GW2011_GWA2_52_8d]
MDTPFWHARSVADTLEALETNPRGLSIREISLRIQRYGRNALPSRTSDPWWRVFARQFVSPMILVLVVASVLSVVLSDLVDAGVIATAILVNIVIGFVQEYKANKALEELRSLVQPTSIVLREGKEISVLATEIVPGDVLVLHTGDRVTADARIFESVELVVNEAALTGESFPVHKGDTMLSAQTPMAAFPSDGGEPCQATTITPRTIIPITARAPRC